jgi:hypothetical protein
LTQRHRQGLEMSLAMVFFLQMIAFVELFTIYVKIDQKDLSLNYYFDLILKLD